MSWAFRPMTLCMPRLYSGRLPPEGPLSSLEKDSEAGRSGAARCGESGFGMATTEFGEADVRKMFILDSKCQYFFSASG